MVKKRKSIRKAPTVVMIEGEEQLFESTEGPSQVRQPTVTVNRPDFGDEDMQDGEDEEAPELIPAKEGGQEEEDSEEAKAKEKAAEEWNAFKEEYHESKSLSYSYPTKHANASSDTQVIEQLPLSLFRSMALVRELDDQVQGEFIVFGIDPTTSSQTKLTC